MKKLVLLAFATFFISSASGADLIPQSNQSNDDLIVVSIFAHCNPGERAVIVEEETEEGEVKFVAKCLQDR